MTRRSSRARLAAELQAKKEDLEGWEAIPSEAPREPSMSISLRLRPDDIDLLQRRAATKGTTVSAVIRDAIQRYFGEAGAPTLRFTLAGQVLFAAGPPGPFTEARRYEWHAPEPQIIEYDRV